jgi:hypothetical protein
MNARSGIERRAMPKEERGTDRTAAHETHLASRERLSKPLGVVRRDVERTPPQIFEGYADSAECVKTLCPLSTGHQNMVIDLSPCEPGWSPPFLY